MSRSATISQPVSTIAEQAEAGSRTTALHAGAWATVDQIVFSAGNFLTTVIIGRWAGATDLGGYSLAFACILVTAAFQRALVTSPYTYLSQQWSGTRRSIYRGSVLVHAASVSLPVALVLAIAIMLLPGVSQPMVTAVAIATALLSWGMQDFCRRIMFADHRFRDALFFDSLTMSVHITLLTTLLYLDRLTATTAILSLAISCAISVIPWFVLSHQLFVVRPRRVRRDLWRNWSFGRWGALSEVTFISQDLGVQALLAACGGIAVTGAYAACMSLVRIANPFVQAVGNTIGPLSARALASGGVYKLASGVRRVPWVMALALATYLTLILVAGRQLLNILYDEKFNQQATLLLPLAVAASITAMGLAPAKAISALRMPRLNLWSHLTSLAITLLLVWLTYERYGTYGVAFGILLGAMAAATLKWYFFCTLTRAAIRNQESAG